MASLPFTPREKVINFVVTSIQYSSMGAFLLLSPKVALGLGWQIVEALGIILALWAIIEMRRFSQVSIAPLPRRGARLLTSGPYRYLRHPMYTSLLVMFIPLLVTHFDVTRAVLLGVLYVNLIGKLLFEESVLRSHFEGYEAYARRSWRIIPFVF